MTTIANGRWTSRAVPCGERQGKQPRRGDDSVISTGRKTQGTAGDSSSLPVHALSAQLIDVDTKTMPFRNGPLQQVDEPPRERHASGIRRSARGRNAADQGEGQIQMIRAAYRNG